MADRRSPIADKNLRRDAIVLLAASASVTGSRSLPSEEVDRAFGMPIGKLRDRAGIHSLAYADEREDQVTIGTQAGHNALKTARCSAQDLDCILATSETHHAYPSLV